MPRTLQEIVDHADEIAQQFEDYEPTDADRRPVAPLMSARAAVQARAQAERAVAEAVKDMRAVNYSWSAIGTVLGTSAEAARQRYGASETRVRAVAVRTIGSRTKLAAPSHTQTRATARPAALPAAAKTTAAKTTASPTRSRAAAAKKTAPTRTRASAAKATTTAAPKPRAAAKAAPAPQAAAKTPVQRIRAATKAAGRG